MGTRVVKMVAYDCDNNDCATIRYTVFGSGEHPPGYLGLVTQVNETGGSGEVTWWACASECIGNAVVHAVARSYEEKN